MPASRRTTPPSRRTTAQLADDAARVVAAGAAASTFTPKDPEGADSLQGEHVDRALAAIRAVTTAPVGVTTGAWAEPDPVARVRAIDAWTVLPDFASLNWHEPGAEHIAAALLERRTAVEAGLWHVDVAHSWAHSPLRDRCLRVLVELPDGHDPAQKVIAAHDMLCHLRHAGKAIPVLLHSEGTSTWPCLRHAARPGLDTRIRLEDALHHPGGSLATDNADLVRRGLTPNLTIWTY